VAWQGSSGNRSFLLSQRSRSSRFRPDVVSRSLKARLMAPRPAASASGLRADKARVRGTAATLDGEADLRLARPMLAANQLARGRDQKKLTMQKYVSLWDRAGVRPVAARDSPRQMNLAVVPSTTSGPPSLKAWPARPRQAWPRHILHPTSLRVLQGVPSGVVVCALLPEHSSTATHGAAVLLKTGADFPIGYSPPRRLQGS